MSDINLDFTADSSNINIVTDTNDITFTPTDVQLNIYTSGVGVPGGLNGALQYNNSGVLSGVPNTQFSSGNLSLGNVANVKITGGANAYYLQTDGAGTLSWVAGLVTPSGNGTAAGANNQIQISDGTGNFKSGAGFTFDNVSNTFAVPGDGYFTGNVYANSGTIGANLLNGTLTTANQSNITTVGTLTDLRTSNLEIHIGANAGAVNQQSYGIAIGANAGSNAQGATAIAIGPLAGNSQQGTVAIAIGSGAGGTQQGTQAIAIGLLAGSQQQGANSIAIGANAGAPTQTVNSIALNASGANLPANNSGFYVNPIRNITGTNVLVYDTTTSEITYTTFSPSSIVNGTSNVNIASANSNVTVGVNGTANVLVIANTGITTNNITATGNVSSNANISASRFISNVATGTAPFVVTSTTQVANLNVATANIATLATTTQNGNTGTQYLVFANVLTNGATTLNKNSLFSANLSNGLLTVSRLNATTLQGTLTAGPQTAITAVGTLGNLDVTNTVQMGNLRVTSSNVRIGLNAGATTQSSSGVAIGQGAGQITQGLQAVSIGFGAGADNQGAGAVAIGWVAGSANGQGSSAVAIGQNSASDNQGVGAVAIGLDSGQINQGNYSVAIGAVAGRTNQAQNSIAINATAANLEAPTSNALFVKPIRDVTGDPNFTVALYYNPITGEIGYK